MAKLFANSGDPDQMLQNVASDLGLHCLPITLFGVSRLKWVKAIKKTKNFKSKHSISSLRTLKKIAYVDCHLKFKLQNINRS